MVRSRLINFAFTTFTIVRRSPWGRLLCFDNNNKESPKKQAGVFVSYRPHSTKSINLRFEAKQRINEFWKNQRRSRATKQNLLGPLLLLLHKARRRSFQHWSILSSLYSEVVIMYAQEQVEPRAFWCSTTTVLLLSVDELLQIACIERLVGLQA